MKRFLFKCLLFIIIFASASTLLSFILDNYFLTNTWNSKVLWASTIRNRDADVIFLGSSRIANMIDTKRFEQISKKKALNLGTSGGAYAENYLILKNYVQKNKIPSYIILNVDEFSLNINYFTNVLGFKHFELSPLFYEKNTNAIYKEVTSQGQYYTWYFLPFSKYIEYNDRLNAHDICKNLIEKNKRGFNSFYGDDLIEKTMFKDSIIPASTLQMNINKLNESYLLKIIELCKTKKIQLLLITPPIYIDENIKSFDRKPFYQYITLIKENHKISYLDFSNSLSLHGKKYFYDFNHTNIHGSILFTEELGRKFKQQCAE